MRDGPVERRELSHSESAARDSVPIEPLRHEHVEAFDVAVEMGAETVVVRVTPRVEIHSGTLAVTFARRSEIPVVVWPN